MIVSIGLNGHLRLRRCRFLSAYTGRESGSLRDECREHRYESGYELLCEVPVSDSEGDFFWAEDLDVLRHAAVLFFDCLWFLPAFVVKGVKGARVIVGPRFRFTLAIAVIPKS